jgi:hypothetical protein
MPAHQAKTDAEKVIHFWQPLWRFLASQNFVVLPAGFEADQLAESSWFQPTTQGGMVQAEAKSFESALQLAMNLKQILKREGRAVLAEWNYLGNFQEKEKYLAYLSRYFWEHQNEESLISKPDYAILIADNFRICKYAEDPDIQLRPPVEFMSERSREFLLKLESSLSQWDLNSFLLNDGWGNFHWTMLASQAYLLEGSIAKNADCFKQTIKLSSVGE